MAMTSKSSIYWITALFLAFVLVLAVLQGCSKDEAEQSEETTGAPNDVAVVPAAREVTQDPVEAATSLFREPKVSLQSVVDGAKTWYPAYEKWHGKSAPDFTLTDIEGNPHKLSDYRGRSVVVVFFATWCGPCKLEVPHLKELREALAEDRLAILAVSNESPALVKSFAQKQGLNYTILLSSGGLPAPYSEVRSIPSSLFIDSEGVIKLGTLGIVPTSDAKAILQAG